MGTPDQERALLLAGMMGSGKSTVGRALAARLARIFVDTDAEVERRAGRSISDIFSAEGESGFRRRETAVLVGLRGSRAVVALGGGAVLDARNREILSELGTVVWLDAGVETLSARIEGAEDRPLLAGMGRADRGARLSSLLEQRREAYATASVRVETDGRSVEEVCDAVLAALGWENAR